MRGEIIKISREKSRNGGRYLLVNFKLEGGEFGQTFLVPSFRNFNRWKKHLKEGNIVANLKIKERRGNLVIVDADSWVSSFRRGKNKGRDFALSEIEMSKMGVFG